MSEFVIGAMVGGVSGIAAGYLAWKKNHICQSVEKSGDSTEH